MSVPSPEVLKEFLLDGLRDAHAMESQAITLTSAQAERLKHYPELERKIRAHLAETEVQRDRLAGCLERLGTSPSTLKDTALKLGANLAAFAHTLADDEVIKNTLASYAFEHFEIAAYTALIETAGLLGDAATAAACETNLKEEQAMAAWILENLPGLVRTYTARKAADVEAKR